MKKLTKMLIIPCATLAIVAAGGAIVSFADPTETVSVQSSVASASDAWKYRTYRDGVTISKYLGTDDNIVIPDEIDGKLVTRLDGNIFSGKAITSVEMPDTIIDIGYNVFENCDKLTDVKLSNSIKELPAGTFRGCKSLEEVELPEALEKFSTSTFYNTILKTLNIPKNVKKIDINWREPMPNIEEYTVDSENEFFSAQDGMLLNKTGDTLYFYPKGKVQEYAYIKLPNNIKTIKAFSELDAWSKSTYFCYFLGDNVTSIESMIPDYEPISIWVNENSEAYKRLKIENYENINVISEHDFDIMSGTDFWFTGYSEEQFLSAYDYFGNEDIINVPSDIGEMKVVRISELIFGRDASTVIIPDTFKSMEKTGVGTRNYEWRIANNDKLVKIVNNSNLDIPVKVVNNKYKGWSRTENGSAEIVNMLPAKTTMYKIKNSSSSGNSGNSGSSSGSHHYSSSSSDSSESGEPATSNKKNTSSAPVGLQITKSPFIMNSWEKVGENWKFRMSDGNYAESQWICSNGKWYLIGKDGNMLTGWQLVNSKWYFMNQDGTLLTGWQFINGKWYYLTADGSMLASAQTPDGYKVDANGAWIQ